MKKENSVSLKSGDVPGRLTRARAAAFHTSGQLPPLKGVSQQSQKQILEANPKRALPDTANPQRKRRAVLQDVSNIRRENTQRRPLNATKVQAKNSSLDKAAQLNAKKSKVDKVVKLPQLQVDSKGKSLPEIGLRSEEAMCSVNLEDDVLRLNVNQCVTDNSLLDSQTSGISSQLLISQQKGVQIDALNKTSLCILSNASKDPDVTNIDSDCEDPQFCCLYATDIYDNLRVAELSRRPYPNYMEAVQKDINQNMRELLVDWLVEVSEEYKLVPDSLYLTVYLIDRFLSKTYIERQRLQLLGITCMLIASKYEEINAPRIEEFCFITENTCTKEEVLKMEIQVLKSSAYQLFAPTTKTFLRRFLRAAEASHKSLSFELEYLTNYLAELTLMHYDFLNFLPSLIAASAVFLARWTLDQSSHPWNPTLQHYTSYRPSDLKATVLALQDLQKNSNGCPLVVIRTKYSQDKFKCVAALPSPELLDTLF